VPAPNRITKKPCPFAAAVRSDKPALNASGNLYKIAHPKGRWITPHKNVRGGISAGLNIGIWSVAASGIGLKLLLPGRFERLSIILHLLLGWSGVIAYDAAVSTFPSSTLWLIAAGGGLYSMGLVFHWWETLRFQNAIWHAFVLLAALATTSPVVDAVGLLRG
jgi:channel protein (hemolysin III family)